MERIWKTTEAWKALRPPLKTWAKVSGFVRARSSPPAYRGALAQGVATVWAQGSAGGIDHHLGGKFAFHIQVGEASMPGVHVADGVDVTTHRAPELFSAAQRQEALSLHNQVVTKRSEPSSGYLLDRYDVGQLRAQFLTPLNALPELDYWPVFVDAHDVTAWGAFFAQHLNGWIEQALELAGGRFGGLLLPQ